MNTRIESTLLQGLFDVVVEIPLLLLRNSLAELDETAAAAGVSVGQVVRRAIQRFLDFERARLDPLLVLFPEPD